MSSPLRDESGGRLKGWPGGGITYPGGIHVPTFRPGDDDEPPAAVVVAGQGRWVDCKYCYRSVLPLVLRESVLPPRVTEMTICSECGAGLTPPEMADHR